MLERQNVHYVGHCNVMSRGFCDGWWAWGEYPLTGNRKTS